MLKNACGLGLMALMMGVAGAQTAGSTATIGLNVFVGDKKGPVGDLHESDFTVLDNGKPQTITSFKAMGKDTPVQIVLLVDTLNVPVPQVNYERSRIETFLKANGGKLAHPTTLAILTEDGIQMAQHASEDGNVLSQSLEDQTTGAHAVNRKEGYNADDAKVQISLNALHSLGEKLMTRPGRKIVLWLSPGWPLLTDARTQNLTAVEQHRIFESVVSISNQLRDANITLDAVNFTVQRNEDISKDYNYEVYLKGVSKLTEVAMGDMALQVIALQSGGQALNSIDAKSLFEKALADADAYYWITFAPAPSEKPDTYHHLEVKVGKKGLKARTRDGYYSQH